MSEWKFTRRRPACSGCERRFEEGERHASALAIQGEDLRREDVCLACWQARASTADLFHWFTRQRAGRRGLQLDLATLEQVFLQLEGRTQGRLLELRYVVALLLLRKRRLKVDRVLRAEGDQGEALLVHRPRRKEALRVVVFDFTAARIAELRDDLLRLFEGAEPIDAAPSGTDAATAPTDDDEAPPVDAVDLPCDTARA